MRKLVLMLCVAICMLQCPNAIAQSSVSLRITPVAPLAFQPITVGASQAGCDIFRSQDPLNREVTVEAGVIRVVVPYFNLFGLCTAPLVPFHWVVAGVPAGNYRLELYGEDPVRFPRALLETIDITVAPGAVASPPVVVPVFSWLGKGGLLTALMLGAWWSLMRRRH